MEKMENIELSSYIESYSQEIIMGDRSCISHYDGLKESEAISDMFENFRDAVDDCIGDQLTGRDNVFLAFKISVKIEEVEPVIHKALDGYDFYSDKRTCRIGTKELKELKDKLKKISEVSEEDTNNK